MACSLLQKAIALYSPDDREPLLMVRRRPRRKGETAVTAIADMTAIELAAFVGNHLTKRAINLVLSGGTGVATYSNGKQVSYVRATWVAIEKLTSMYRPAKRNTERGSIGLP